MTTQQVAFWVLAPIMVLAALGMILARKAVHAALLLAVVMICLAMMYAVQEAPFLFVVQIIVYTGAILMLFLFVLMLVGVDSSDSLVETIRGHRFLAALGGIGFAVLLLLAIGSVAWGHPLGLNGTSTAEAPTNAGDGGNPVGLATLLFTKYVFAFEVTSALLITAALGAMLLAFKERLRPKLTQRQVAQNRMRQYADRGVHPGPLPTPGVLARHNAVDTPALLPDGSVAPTSVSSSLRRRGQVVPGALEAGEIGAVGTIEAQTGDSTARIDSINEGTPLPDIPATDTTDAPGQTGDGRRDAASDYRDAVAGATSSTTDPVRPDTSRDGEDKR